MQLQFVCMCVCMFASTSDLFVSLICSEYEKKNNVPPGTILRAFVEKGNDGAWAKMERGELPSNQLSSNLSAEIKSVVSVFTKGEIIIQCSH